MKSILFVGSHSEELAGEIKAGLTNRASVIFAEKTQIGRDWLAKGAIDVDVIFTDQ